MGVLFITVSIIGEKAHTVGLPNKSETCIDET